MAKGIMLFFITILTVIVAHHVMVLFHEWSHSIVGWFFATNYTLLILSMVTGRCFMLRKI